MIAVTRLKAVAWFDLLGEAPSLHRLLEPIPPNLEMALIAEAPRCTTSTSLTHRFGEALQRILVRNVNLSVSDLHGARFPHHP
jgi:hypothetical protein